MCKYQQSILQSNLSYVETCARISRVVCALDWQFGLKAHCVTPTSSTPHWQHESLQNVSQESSLMASRLLAYEKGKQNMAYAVYSLFSLLTTRGALCKTEVLQV